MKISEIFLGIQGEGKEIGLPTVFTRFIGCNLRCKWCDTKYAYEGGVEMNAEQIYEKIVQVGEWTKRVCLTGGEPLLQNIENLKRLLKLLTTSSYYVSVETNGSIPLENWMMVQGRLFNSIVMDWKCSSSKMNSKMLQSNLIWLNSDDQIKFVIGTKKDFYEALKIVDYYKDRLVKPHFIFSPVYKKMNPKELVELLINNKVDGRMQLQLHKQIYGPRKRGV